MTKIGQQQSKSLFEVGENLNAVVAGAKKLKSKGIVVVNLGANDILEKNTDVVLGLVWQLVRAHLLRDVNLVSRPELIRLLQAGETLRDLLDMSSEQLLIRWVNYHLERAGEVPIRNFGSDIVDGRAYLTLMDQVCPRSIDRDVISKALKSQSAEERAQAVLSIAEEIGCKRFVTLKDILGGQSRLNLAFTAGIFNEYIGIVLPSDDEVRALVNRVDDLELENGSLKAALAERDEEMAAMLREVENLKNEWLSRDAEKGNDIKRQVQELIKQHQREIDGLKKKMNDEAESRETEIKAMLDAVKAKSKQQVLALERQNEKMRSQVTRDLNNIKRSLEDFLIANGMMDQPNLEVTSFEEVTPLLKDHLVKILQGYYEQADEVKRLEVRIQRMEQVNAVIGDKIQEYAEGMIDGKKKKSRKGTVFGLF